jgi:hypothetical protein
MAGETRITIKGTEKLEAAFIKAPSTIRAQMRYALDDSMNRVIDYARTHHRFRPGRNADLENSIQGKIEREYPPRGVVSFDPQNITVNWIGHGPTPYSVFVHKGTRPHPIPARWKKCLRWVGPDGNFRFAKRVKHPGTTADPFLTNAGKMNRDAIRRIFALRISMALMEAGLK